jgi:hypothetical protein
MKKYILSLAAFLVFFTISASAQTQDEVELMQRSAMVAEIKKLRTENAAKDTIIAEQKSTIEVYKKLDGVQEARIADLKEALKFRTEAGNIDVKIENMYKQSIAEYKGEVDRLRVENDKLRKSRDRRSLLMGIAGLIGGALIF